MVSCVDGDGATHQKISASANGEFERLSCFRAWPRPRDLTRERGRGPEAGNALWELPKPSRPHSHFFYHTFVLSHAT